MDVRAALDELRRSWPDAALLSAIREGEGRRNALHRVELGGARAVLKVAARGTLAIERTVLGRLGEGLAAGDGWLVVADHGEAEDADDDTLLTAWGRALGRLHERTAGFRWEGPCPPVDVDHAVYRWRRGIARLPASLGAVGVRLHARAERELQGVVRILSAPGACVLTHGDAGPPNGIFRGGEVRLVDWEVAGPRHRAFDWFPVVQRWLRADPRAWSPAAEGRFRSAYLAEHPAAEADLDRQLAAVAVAWAAVAALTLPARLVADGRSGSMGHRRRIAGAVGEAAERAEAHLPAIARELRRASDRLVARGWARG